jgi:hypothetical protein
MRRPIKAYDSVEGPEKVDVETPPCPRCHEGGWVTITSNELDALLGGEPIQSALPNTPAPEREQIRTGYHPDCWAAAFGE